MNRFHRFLPLLAFLLAATATPAPAQQAVPAADTTAADSTVIRMTKPGGGLEGPVVYEAQRIENLIGERRTILTGRAKVEYMDMKLTAAKIVVEWDSDAMIAEGVWDSAWVSQADTTDVAETDSVLTTTLTGAPEFTEAGDVLTGEVMHFNFRTRKGRVLRGRTKFQDGFYTGTALKLVEPKTLNVAKARFTTCEKEEDPHFHFLSEKMKIQVDKRVIAKPLVMYVGRIPVGILPFFYFPIQRGRQSGIIIPRYGESSLEGRYLRGMGYYWAASEYWDVQGTVDYYEKAGFLFRGDLRYNLRYRMSGGISTSWTRKDFEVNDTQQRRWDMVVRHSQTISPTMSLSVNGNFVSSGSFYQDVSANREQRMQQEIRSNATLSKRFPGSKSITVNLNQTRNLKTNDVSEVLPRISFRGGQSPIFKKPEAGRGEQVESRWYHNIYFSYGSQMLRKRSKRTLGSDSTATVQEDRGMGWDHDIRLSSSQKLFGWLSLNPSLSYNETWLDRRKMYRVDAETGEIVDDDEHGFFARRTYDLALGFNTKVYGLFAPRFLKNVMVRHVATPTISISYKPDFSEDRFGYFQTVVDSTGEEEQYDRYSGSIFGGTTRGSSRRMSFNLSNLFQMKIGEGEKEKKLDLFNWNLSTSYNWEATQYKLSDLSSSIQARPFRQVNMNMRTTYTFYQHDESGSRVDRLFLEDVDFGNFKSILTGRWLRMTNLTAGLDFQLKGRTRTDEGGDARNAGEASESDPIAGEESSDLGDRLEMDDRVGGLDMPWSLRASLNYSVNRSNPLNTTKTFWARMNLELSLTKHWKISYRTQWDLMKMEPVSQDFVFYRDLHCWEARIAWTPTGYNKRFFFTLSVKSPLLKDLKIEKGTGLRGFSSSSIGGLY